MNPIRTRLAAAAIGIGLVIAAPAAAWAGPRRPVSTSPSSPSDADHRDIEAVRTRCLAAIDVRLPALAAARAALSANQHVTGDHEAALTADIEQTSARLRVLADLIKADADLAALRDHCRSTFEDNRVFALVLPRVRLVLGADTAIDAVPGAVLGLTPADWNANHEVLTPPRQSLRAARADLKVARDLAHKIRTELKPPAASPQT